MGSRLLALWTLFLCRFVVCRYSAHIHRLKPWIESFISQPVFHCFPLKETFRYLFFLLIPPSMKLKKHFLKTPVLGLLFHAGASVVVAHRLSCPMPGM